MAICSVQCRLNRHLTSCNRVSHKVTLAARLHLGSEGEALSSAAILAWSIMKSWGEHFMGRTREFDPDLALDQMLRVFWEKGFDATSYADLTKATGVAKPGLYRTFGNKEDLFFKALERHDRHYVSAITDGLGEPVARKAVERLLKNLMHIQAEPNAPLGCFTLNAEITSSTQTDRMRLAFQWRRERIESMIYERLQRSKHEGDLVGDPRTICNLIIAVNKGLAIEARAGKSKSLLTMMIDEFVAGLPLQSRA